MGHGDAVEHGFDAEYWERHWVGGAHAGESTPNPYVVATVEGLAAGHALDAGSGEGAESIWLAAQGWRVTGVDISANALARAAQHATAAGVTHLIDWMQADLTTWTPQTGFDLVVTSYAHPAGSQLALYERLAGWVAPGGVLLLVAHGHGSSTRDGGDAPIEASVTVESAVAAIGPGWSVEVADEVTREVARPGGEHAVLHDVVVRAIRTA